MLFLLVAFLILVKCVFSARDPMQFQALDISRGNQIEDITPITLQKYPVIFIDDDSSVIVSRFLYHSQFDPRFLSEIKAVFDPKMLKERAKGNKQYIQMRYTQPSEGARVVKTAPLAGCFDNSFSDTNSLVTRTFARSASIEGNLDLSSTVLGYDVDVHAKTGITSLLEEKTICMVPPRSRLQIAVTSIKDIMHLHEQRILTINKSDPENLTIEFSEWTDIDGPTDFELVMQSIGCVTDEEFLSC
ncbi:hypothetical protein JCM33374_g6488 [Metschnikowia sp. JCM 33374]|nr:hypothetical protein JCM33374_g6488 [Metschnikowia sp. JCM 33374]